MRRHGITAIMAINDFVDRHPYLGFAIFLAVAFGLMALCGLSDGPERAAQLGGM